MKLLCIDPGTFISGCVEYQPDKQRIAQIMPSVDNVKLLIFVETLKDYYDELVIEMVGHYGMPVGREVFETVRWIGRYEHAFGIDKTSTIQRTAVKLQLCRSAAANDANVRRALLDRFPATGGGKEPAIGTKAQPGPLYGLTRHAVHALAAGVAHWELTEERKHAGD